MYKKCPVLSLTGQENVGKFPATKHKIGKTSEILISKPHEGKEMRNFDL